jgi:hypothetical protein
MSTQAISSFLPDLRRAHAACGDAVRRGCRAAAGDGTEFLEGMLFPAPDAGAGRLLALPARNATLVCVEGEVWLTRDGDREDYILGAGSSLHLGQRDQAMVQALKASRLRLILA